ncbi:MULTISPECIES: aminoglycoside phosphotransferase family protein [unclassified Fusibacter]|uniref:aminoglycoside phosphotransferase family protein n=1 Tax=unclassified Fusibacter TaxID=2624464 RepID=UPI00101189DF|nr:MULTISPECIES: aminoglycoside phosphotransferase family protein [unclassified Fusibacter]MCK8059713.1 aminoglycoside phosphotransferase family protein [Fusibacter sp. A2]NPE21514.1 aminoglycoside phosphotransferase family protein [Fusibacter sp. A1]RXV61924.1 aminoglycoside phosphotransferase family protein [Fusibacter sp. A1]
MLTYTDKDIRNHVEEIFDRVEAIIPIGHHDINRNLVYKVTTAEKDYVIKYYFKKDKCCNEVRTIKLLTQAGIKCPGLIKSDVTKDHIEYSIIEFVEGVPLIDVQSKMTEKNLNEVYFKMGQTLAEIHSIKDFDHFKTWEVNEESQPWVHSFKASIEHDLDRFFIKYDPEEHDAFPLIKRAYTEVKNNLDAFDVVEKAVLCHHDFSPRNIMVSPFGDDYQMTYVFDFEHSKPSADILDIIDTGLMIEEQLPQVTDAFYKGYRSVRNFSEDHFSSLKRLVSFYIAIVICSWSRESAPDFYDFGISLIEENLEE